MMVQRVEKELPIAFRDYQEARRVEARGIKRHRKRTWNPVPSP
jgi:hypothetical protein